MSFRIALGAGVPLLLAAAVALFSAGPRSGQAASFVVTTTADNGAGSFRQALTDAGTSPGLDVITFDPTVFPAANPATIQATATYVVEDPAASQPLTIDGTGAGVIINGSGIADGGGVIHFRPNGPVSGITLKHFTIQNFNSGEGNGIEIGFMPTDVSDVLIEDLTVRDNDGTGISLNAGATMTNVVIRNSDVSSNGSTGIFLGGSSLADVIIENNTVEENESHGVEIKADSSPVPASVSVTENDITSNSGDGIFVSENESGLGPHVTISQNRTTANDGLGIDLVGGAEDSFDVTANDPGDADDGPNKLLNFPVLNGVGPTGIVGTACANCTVELFIGDSDPSGHGEGGGYFATGTADGDGDFEISGCGQNGGATVTATATDPNGNTSEFAENYTLPTTPPCPTPTPSPTPAGETVTWGDDNCSQTPPDPVDSLITLRFDAGLSTNTGDCPAMGATVDVLNFSLHPWGDIDCGGDVNPVDSLKLLRFDAGLPLTQPASCPEIGTEVAIVPSPAA